MLLSLSIQPTEAVPRGGERKVAFALRISEKPQTAQRSTSERSNTYLSNTGCRWLEPTAIRRLKLATIQPLKVKQH